MAHDKSGHESLQSDMYFGGRTPQPTPTPTGLLQGCVELSKSSPACDPTIPAASFDFSATRTETPVPEATPQVAEQQKGKLLPLLREGGRRILGTPHN